MFMEQLIKKRWLSLLSDLVHLSFPVPLPPAPAYNRKFQRGKATVAPSLRRAWLAIFPVLRANLMIFHLDYMQ